jgi:hypothetical protein
MQMPVSFLKPCTNDPVSQVIALNNIPGIAAAIQINILQLVVINCVCIARRDWPRDSNRITGGSTGDNSRGRWGIRDILTNKCMKLAKRSIYNDDANQRHKRRWNPLWQPGSILQPTGVGCRTCWRRLVISAMNGATPNRSNSTDCCQGS